MTRIIILHGDDIFYIHPHHITYNQNVTKYIPMHAHAFTMPQAKIKSLNRSHNRHNIRLTAMSTHYAPHPHALATPQNAGPRSQIK
jgi:hypothetical protein